MRCSGSSTPTLLIGGWQDIFVGQTVEQYQALRSRGVEVALTLGPWTHRGHVVTGSSVIDNEALSWFDTHLGSGRAGGRTQPVHTSVTGRNTWHSLPAWPPNSTETTWYPSDDGLLATTAPAGGQSTLRYDPHDPTPSVGGRRLAADAGVRNNAKLEARRDVLSFSTSELTTDLEFEGFPVVDVALSVDNPYVDIFVRICDVDPKGRSHNISDAFASLDPVPDAGEVQHLTLRLSPCAHRLLAGHRLRMQVSGGAHPQYARNLGSGEPPATGTSLKPARHTIHHADTRLTLPITSTMTTITA